MVITQEANRPTPNARPMSESGVRSSEEVANRADQLILLGDVEGALRLFKSHLRQDPFDARIVSLVDSLLLGPEQGRGLIDFYKDLQKEAPDDWRLIVSLARACSRTGKDSIAVVQLQKLLRTDSQHPEVWMELAMCYKRLDKLELALRALNSLIDLQHDYAPAHLARLRFLVEADELEEAAAASVFSLECHDLPPAVRDWLDKVNLILEQGRKPPAELMQKNIPLTPSRIPTAAPRQANLEQDKTLQMLAFTAMIAILVKGGLSYGRIFGLLSAHLGDTLGPVMKKLEDSVIRDGEPLSKALAKHPEVFADHYVAMIELGESTNLSRVLDRLSDQLRKEYLKNHPGNETTAALALASRNLVDALEAGGDEAKALSFATRVCLDETVRKAFQDLEKQVNNGIRLAECKYPAIFTPLFDGLIAAHDAVGLMPQAFKDLARLLGH